MARQRLDASTTTTQPTTEPLVRAGLGNARREARARGGDAPGRAVPLPHRASLEAAFGEDFGDVEVRVGVGDALTHTGMEGASAGNRLLFAEASPDKALVAHELAHVVQHREAPSARTLSRPGDQAEREATDLGARAARGEAVSVEASAGGVHAGWLSKAFDGIKSGIGRAWEATRNAVGSAWRWLTGDRAPAREAPTPTTVPREPTRTAPPPTTQAPARETTPSTAPPVQEVTPEPEVQLPYDPDALRAASDAAVAAAPESMRDYAATSIPAILTECALKELTSVDQVAYVLATTEHESHFGRPLYARSESLVEERNKITQQSDGSWTGTVHVTGRTIRADSLDAAETAYWDDAYGGRLGNEKGTRDARDYRGRGFVQITGRSNYARMSDQLNEQGFSYTHEGQTWGGPGNPPIDLVANPTHTNLVPALAARILVHGMTEGSFTGRGLDRYLGEGEPDFVNARRIVNGDVSRNGERIADYARRYVRALSPHWSAVARSPLVS